MDIVVDSAALGHSANARVLLPPSAGAGARATAPVLYLLPGGLETYVSWSESSDVAALTAGSRVIVVMPDCGSLGFYANWWNHGRSTKPAWETFHLTELVQIVERRFGAGPSRAIAGFSMGGFGAVSYAARRPDLFRAAAAYSGVLDTRHPTTEPLSSGPYAEWVLSAFFEPLGYDPLALFGDPVRQAEIWAAHNPADLVENLRDVKVLLCCGNGELGPLDPPEGDPNDLLAQLEAALLRHNEEFLARARRAGVDATADFYGAGTHTFPYWARALESSLPALLAAIGAGPDG